MATKDVISPEDLERVVSLLERIATNCSTLHELCVDALDEPRHAVSAAAAADVAKLTGCLATYAATIAQGWPGTFGDAAEEWLLPKSCAPQRAGVEDLMGTLRSMPAGELRAHVAAALQALKAEGGGSSQAPARALLLAEPPSADAGEITDKGYLNQRAVLKRRDALVQLLYTGGPEVILARQP